MLISGRATASSLRHPSTGHIVAKTRVTSLEILIKNDTDSDKVYSKLILHLRKRRITGINITASVRLQNRQCRF